MPSSLPTVIFRSSDDAMLEIMPARLSRPPSVVVSTTSAPTAAAITTTVAENRTLRTRLAVRTSERLSDTGIDAELRVARTTVQRHCCIDPKRAERRDIAQADARTHLHIGKI